MKNILLLTFTAFLFACSNQAIFNSFGYDWQDTLSESRQKGIDNLKKWVSDNKGNI